MRFSFRLRVTRFNQVILLQDINPFRDKRDTIYTYCSVHLPHTMHAAAADAASSCNPSAMVWPKPWDGVTLALYIIIYACLLLLYTPQHELAPTHTRSSRWASRWSERRAACVRSEFGVVSPVRMHLQLLNTLHVGESPRRFGVSEVKSMDKAFHIDRKNTEHICSRHT